MYAKFLNYNNGIKNFCIENPSWAQIEQAIISLEQYDWLILSPSEDKAAEDLFGVRVAEKGIYVCNYYDGDEYDLESENGQELSPPLNIGEFTFYSTAEFVDLSITLKAAKTYLEDGKMNTSLSWWESKFEEQDGALHLVKNRVLL